ncbi:uncharacterized protein LODBEIA_P59950 [Lodderomyces beijingensis]|uniref:Guanine nucleotide-binding protein subunit gamma n=1 Tax=Lodderomyces beijingensis TaxID=1775926 RepID=A0ABP0ZUG3_9ASCO
MHHFGTHPPGTQPQTLNFQPTNRVSAKMTESTLNMPGTKIQKQSQQQQQQVATQIQLIKLQRIQAMNIRLSDTLKRERIPASKASELIISFVEETPDYLIPYNWKLPADQNKFARYQQFKILNQRGSRSVGGGAAGCCTIM